MTQQIIKNAIINIENICKSSFSIFQKWIQSYFINIYDDHLFYKKG